MRHGENIVSKLTHSLLEFSKSAPDSLPFLKSGHYLWQPGGWWNQGGGQRFEYKHFEGGQDLRATTSLKTSIFS